MRVQVAFALAGASIISAAVTGGITRLGGLNLAGFDFGIDTTGSVSGSYVIPPVEQVQHFARQGVNLFRLPLGWQYIQPTLGGPLNKTVLIEYNKILDAALDAGAHVILDIHNYARWNGGIIGQGGPSNEQFGNLWKRLATKHKTQSHVIFGIMNEPHDLDINTWATSVQAAVDAIRSAGATSQYILVPGDTYTSAGGFPEWYPVMKTVKDSAGKKNNLLIFDIHQYLDSDGSGTHSTCTNSGTSNLANVVSLLFADSRQALLSETGGGEDSTCLTDVPEEIAFVKKHYPYLAGFAGWAAGAFDTSYVLSLTPNPSNSVDGTDQQIWTAGFKPYLP